MRRVVKSPLGNIEICELGGKIVKLVFTSKSVFKSEANAALDKAELALKNYFKGQTNALKKLRVAPQGTEFQKKVWNELLKLKAQEKITYSELAKRIKKPKAFRAVGSAVGKNPICLAIPCHRVVAKSGLGGFSAGLKRKKSLLKLEGLL